MEKIIPRHSPLERLLTADSVTMYISNQNNGRMGQILHHKYMGPKGAVAALSRRVAQILIHSGTEENLLCDYSQTETWEAVQSSENVDAVLGAEKNIKLQE